MNKICLDGYEYLLLNYDKFINKLNAFSEEKVSYTKYRKIADTLGVNIETIRNWITRESIIKYKTYNKIKDKLEEYNLIP